MIITQEMRDQILRAYNAEKTSGGKAALVRKLKNAGMPIPVRGAKHSRQDDTIANLLGMAAKAAAEAAKAAEEAKAAEAAKTPAKPETPAQKKAA